MAPRILGPLTTEDVRLGRPDHLGPGVTWIVQFAFQGQEDWPELIIYTYYTEVFRTRSLDLGQAGPNRISR